MNAGLAIENGQIKVIDSVDGKVVDRAALAETLSSLLVTLRSATVEVPIVAKEPDVKADDNQAAQKQAETMISGPVTVTGGGKEWTVAPEEIASYMGFRAEMKNGVSTLVPFMDATKLQPLLDEIAPAVLQKPTNASFDHNDTRAWVVPGKERQATGRRGHGRRPSRRPRSSRPAATVKAVLKIKEPSLTTEEAKARGIQDKLSYYTTTYSCTADRQTNVKLATKYATNVFLAPGQAYDFDKQIGPRMAARGWQMAPRHRRRG